jgi:hypothetical protein
MSESVLVPWQAHKACLLCIIWMRVAAAPADAQLVGTPLSPVFSFSNRVIIADLKEIKGPGSMVWQDSVGAGRTAEGLRAYLRKPFIQTFHERLSEPNPDPATDNHRNAWN